MIIRCAESPHENTSLPILKSRGTIARASSAAVCKRSLAELCTKKRSCVAAGVSRMKTNESGALCPVLSLHALCPAD